MSRVITALYLADSLIHLLSCCPPVRERLRRATKCLLMPLLTLWYGSVAIQFSPLLAAGLLFGGLGDALLAVPNKSWAFASGAAAFAAGHVCYAVYFFSRTRWDALPPGWVIAALAVFYLLGIAALMRVLWPRIPKDLFVPCLFYMAVICLMSVSAFLFSWSRGGGWRFITFIGSVLFLFSDAVLCIGTFRRKLKYRHLIVMSTYLPAQTMIACAAAVIGGLRQWNF